MVNFEQVMKYCCEDVSLIENYENAICDNNYTWHCHHRKETDCGLTRNDLEELGLYYDRPASELVFLSPMEHVRLHRIGSHHKDETIKKISDAAYKRYENEEYHNKIKDHLNKLRPTIQRKEKFFICPLLLAYYNTKRYYLYELAELFKCDFRIVKKRAKKYGIKLNLRKGWEGKKHTDETKRKMSEARKKKTA